MSTLHTIVLTLAAPPIDRLATLRHPKDALP